MNTTEKEDIFNLIMALYAGEDADEVSGVDISDNMSFNLEMTPTKEHEDGIVKMHDVSMFHSFNVSSKFFHKIWLMK